MLRDLRGEDSIGELCRPLPDRVMQSMIPRGVRVISHGTYYKRSKDFMESGKRSLAGVTARAANTDEVTELVHEEKDIKEVVAEQTLKLRLMKNMTGDGNDH